MIKKIENNRPEKKKTPEQKVDRFFKMILQPEKMNDRSKKSGKSKHSTNKGTKYTVKTDITKDMPKNVRVENIGIKHPPGQFKLNSKAYKKSQKKTNNK